MKKLALLLVGPALLSLPLGGSDAFAQLVLDFDTDPSALGVVFTGNAQWYSTDGAGDPATSGFLSVTDNLNSQRGAIIFPDLSGGATFPGIRITADLRVGGGTDRPADGFSFNYARPDDPVLSEEGGGIGEGWAASPNGEANLPEEGTTTGLAIGFDEWFSGGEDVVGMSIRVDNDLIHQVELPTLNGELGDITSLQTGPRGPEGEGDDSFLGWAALEIDLAPDGKGSNLAISWKGNEVFNGPVDYTLGPGQLVFGGRTGGANGNHHIDNISVTLVPEPSSLLIALSGLVAVLVMLRRRRRAT